MDKPVYNIVLSSYDKISGSNNNATFQVNFRDFLPEKYNKYNVNFSFNLVEKGNYINGYITPAPTPTTRDYLQVFTYSMATVSSGYNYQGNSSVVIIDPFYTASNLVGMQIRSDPTAQHSWLFYINSYTNIVSTSHSNGLTTLNIDGVIQHNVNAINQLIYIWDDSVTNEYISDISQSTKIIQSDLPVDATYCEVDTLDHIFTGQSMIFEGMDWDATNVVTTSFQDNKVYFNTAANFPNIIKAGTKVTFVDFIYPDVNNTTFNSARILANFNCKSYSYDSNTQSPTLILGYVNSYNTSGRIYANLETNPPKTIARPSNNLLNIQIFNNATFQGGITSYNCANPYGYNDIPTSYSVTPTNNNFYTDTTNDTDYRTFKNDMTNWVMNIAFSPVEDDIRKNQYEL